MRRLVDHWDGSPNGVLAQSYSRMRRAASPSPGGKSSPPPARADVDSVRVVDATRAHSRPIRCNYRMDAPAMAFAAHWASKMLTVSDSRLLVTTSGLPSPFTSPTASCHVPL